MRRIYADNAATTAVSREVLEAMLPYFCESYGNPSSLHAVGREAKKALDASRATLAAALNCDASEIYFTSCGSESDNWAIRGGAHSKKGKKHIITTKIEHHAALHACKALEKEGYEVTYVGVDENGYVDPADIAAAMRPDTALVSVMMANNEIGTIQPIKEIAEIAHKGGALMFTDAVQAVGNIPVDVKELGVDMLALSGHKIHAPKGIGALYCKKGVRPDVLIEGGGQERGRRGGTEALASIVGLAKAAEIANAELSEMDKVAALRDKLIDGILEKIPYSRLNGGRSPRLPGNVNVAFEFIEGESLLLLLDMEGICASTGSACSSNSLEPSHVLLATGLPVEKAHGSLRLSISKETTEEDVDYILEKLPAIVQRLRDMSPLYEEVTKNNK
ncbi:MAG: cysteine desulfurase NifS [Ruminococcaceae bacterium]|nr:cysteine desulfurase NifS [Oscillospiraceae bacterium]